MTMKQYAQLGGRARTRRAQQRLTTRLAMLYVTTCASVGAGSVLAQDQGADAAVIAAARGQAIEGVKLAQSDHCQEAIEKLERAEKLHHAPIVLTRLGECYIKVGRLVAGVESLRTVLREPLPSNASEALAQAYEDAKAALEAAKPKLANLTIAVTGVTDDVTLNLLLDGRALPAAILGVAQPSDPGEHTVVVSADGYLPASRNVTLAPGEEQTVSLPLTASAHSAVVDRPQLTVPAEASPAREPEPFVAPATDSVSHWPAYISWGVGAVALGVGVGFGMAAMNNKSDLKEHCNEQKICPEADRALLDKSHTNATLSTVGFGVAAGGAALGLLLYLLEKPNSDHDSSAQAVRVGANARGVTLSF
jgi:tetratricopeptide (TPR) repeat protein